MNTRGFLFMAWAVAGGCYEPATYVTALETGSLVFQVPEDCDGERLEEDESYTCIGIFPNLSALEDENNPFVRGSSPFGMDVPDDNNGWKDDPPDWLCQDSTHWRINGEGGPVAAFYAWATLLAQGSEGSQANPDIRPPGEQQYYGAVKLREILDEPAFTPATGSATLLAMTIRAFQTVLTDFPDAVTYDATGRVTYELATPSYLALVELGGKIPEGWTLVALPNDGQRAVPVTAGKED